MTISFWKTPWVQLFFGLASEGPFLAHMGMWTRIKAILGQSSAIFRPFVGAAVSHSPPAHNPRMKMAHILFTFCSSWMRISLAERKDCCVQTKILLGFPFYLQNTLRTLGGSKRDKTIDRPIARREQPHTCHSYRSMAQCTDFIGCNSSQTPNFPRGQSRMCSSGSPGEFPW